MTSTLTPCLSAFVVYLGIASHLMFQLVSGQWIRIACKLWQTKETKFFTLQPCNTAATDKEPSPRDIFLTPLSSNELSSFALG